ncbi:hypothetical protein CG478_013970 [Bacillus cytotoxicus]|nr:hypothetical protein CG483_013970 [Bacillus cytotoxicus]AWC33333.1 hypothetical protein CG482_013720 [Bacillus cytotoxicus]AWC37312.1 hypothetical protein CG481_013495 [Bacillus cytotoxicus]AWC41452.1 hypothetical protein CG480_013970 [Bacillus cytotoxicus]AWC45298.1 hypothetical protein CG479_012940 [Bacillus cytotoxicus]
MRTLLSIISQPAHIGMLPTLYSVTSSMVKGGNILVQMEKVVKKTILRVMRVSKNYMILACQTSYEMFLKL